LRLQWQEGSHAKSYCSEQAFHNKGIRALQRPNATS
jgi:hypothetical protein